MTKADLARAIKVDESLPTKWESGARQPQLDNLESVAAACRHRLRIVLLPEGTTEVTITVSQDVARLAESVSELSSADLETLTALARRLSAAK